MSIRDVTNLFRLLPLQGSYYIIQGGVKIIPVSHPEGTILPLNSSGETINYFSSIIVGWPYQEYKAAPDSSSYFPELELELIQTQMAQKPMLRAEVYAHAMRASQNRKKEVRREKKV